MKEAFEPQRLSSASREHKAKTLFVNGYDTKHFNYRWHFGPDVLDSLPDLDVAFMSTVSMTHHRSVQNFQNHIRFVKTILQVGPSYDYLFCHENTYSSRLIAALKKIGFLRKPKLVLLEFDIDMVRGSKMRRYSVEWFMRMFYTSADLILASSNYQKETYRQTQMFKNTCIDYIPSSLSDNRVAFLESKAAAAPSAPVPGSYVFSVGQSNRDFTSLLHAAKDFPDKKFIIMARQIAEGAPPNVTFVNWGTYENYMSYFVNAELIILPLKRHQHAAGLTTLFESWAVSKPVIVAATDAIKEFTKVKESTVLSYRPEDATDLSRQLKHAYSEPDILNVIAKNGHSCLHENYTSRAYLAQLREKLKELET